MCDGRQSDEMRSTINFHLSGLSFSFHISPSARLSSLHFSCFVFLLRVRPAAIKVASSILDKCPGRTIVARERQPGSTIPFTLFQLFTGLSCLASCFQKSSLSLGVGPSTRVVFLSLV